MGAIGGIMICDYFLLRKKQLNLAALFKTDGVYSYSNGYNWRAIVALIAAIAPVIPGFFRAATTPGGQVADANIFDTLYIYAWFVTFAIGFVLYLILMKMNPANSPSPE
jgi:NCS1 family nucleobase:cation symporter-1